MYNTERGTMLKSAHHTISRSLLMALAVTATVASAQTPTAFVDSKGLFTLKLVPGFTKEANPAPTGDLVFNGPVLNDYKTNFGFQAFPCETMTAKDFVDGLVTQSKGNDKIKFLKNGTGKVGETTGYTYSLERTLDNGQIVVQKGYFTVRNRTAFALTFVIDKASLPKFEEPLAKMVASFRWK